MSLAPALETGRAYRVRRVTEIRAHGRIAREDQQATLRVTSAREDGWTVRYRVERADLSVPSGAVDIPPAPGPVGLELELFLDDRGRVRGAPRVVSDAETSSVEPGEMVGWFALGASVLPERRLTEGETWTESGPWIWRQLEGGDASGERTTRFTLRRITDERVVVEVEGASTGGESPVALDGSLELSREDALVGLRRVTGRRDGERVLGVQSCVRPARASPCPDVAPLIHEPPPDRPTAVRYEGAECDARVERLTARMREAARGSVPSGPSRVELPQVEGGSTIEHVGAILETDGEQVWVDGRSRDADRALEDLVTMRRNWGVLSGGDRPFVIDVRAAGDAPLDSVLPLLGRVAALEVTRLVVRGTEEPAPTPPYPDGPPHVAAAIEGLPDPESTTERAEAEAEMASNAIGGCTPVIRAFGRAASVPASEKHRRLMEWLPPAIRECRCGGVDVDLLEAFMVLARGGPGSDRRTLPLPLSDAPDAEPLTLGGDATVADLAQALAERDEPERPAHVRLR